MTIPAPDGQDRVWRLMHGLDPKRAEPDVNGPNPKDLAGRCKPDLALVSGTMLAHMAAGLADGAAKYGVANWRDIPVEARTYISAAMRHLTDWMDREERASDSDVHHLGHALATIGIVLDALAVGTLIDNRPKTAGRSSKVFEELSERRKARELAEKPRPEMPHPAQQLAIDAFRRELAPAPRPEKRDQIAGGDLSYRGLRGES